MEEGHAVGDVALDDGAVDLGSVDALDAAEGEETNGEVAFEVDATGSEDDDAFGEAALEDDGAFKLESVDALGTAEGKPHGEVAFVVTAGESS